MIFTSSLLILSFLNPSPFIAQSAIDSARIIGLPRMFTFDEFLSKQIIETGEMEQVVLISYRNARRKFFTNYFRINGGIK